MEDYSGASTCPNCARVRPDGVACARDQCNDISHSVDAPTLRRGHDDFRRSEKQNIDTRKGIIGGVETHASRGMFRNCCVRPRWGSSCGGCPFGGEEYGNWLGLSVRPVRGSAGDLSSARVAFAVGGGVLVGTHLWRLIVLPRAVGPDEN
jgi:hypothetical protein